MAALCWAALLADGYDLFVYGATLPALQAPAPWAVSATAAGVVGSIGLVGVMVGAVTSGVATDRVGRRPVLVAGLAVVSLAMLGCALAPGFPAFGAFRFVTGVGIGGVIPTAVALVSETAAPGTRSRTLGLVMTGPPVGGLVAGVAAVVLLPEHGFRPVYAIGAAALLLVVLVAWRLPGPVRPVWRSPAPRDGAARTPAVLFRSGRGPSTLGFWLVMAALMLSTFGVTTWLPQTFRAAGYGLGSALTFLIVFTGGAVVGTVAGATLADRVGAKGTGAFALAAGGVGLLLLAFTDATGTLLACVAVAGCGSVAAQALVNDHVVAFYPPGSRGTGLGWALGVGRIGAIAGPVYGAAALSLAGGSVGPVALAFGLPLLLGAAVLAVLPRRSPSASGPGRARAVR